LRRKTKINKEEEEEKVTKRIIFFFKEGMMKFIIYCLID
jgi:hypothetical protein